MAIWRPTVRRWQWALAAVLVLVGFLGVLQFRAGRSIRQEVALPTVRVRDLAVLVKQQEEALHALQTEVETLRNRLSQYEQAAVQGRSSSETLTQEVSFYHVVLGLTSVGGPGIVVRLKPLSIPGGVVMTAVQAADLSGLVNELWSAGAEAISVNGYRVQATTGFRSDEQGIITGAFRLHPPYEIQAIGNPVTMKATLNLRGGFVEGLRSVGLDVQVLDRPSLILPPYRGPLRFRYAIPR